jgi:hypothetical protein
METTISRRAIAMLRAVGAGRGEIGYGAEPDLFVDGLPCCDQYAAHALAHNGFVRPERPGRPGLRMPAVLTAAGLALIAG